MKMIPLTQGKFAMVDDADFVWLSQWLWQAQKGKSTWYAQRTDAGLGRKNRKLIQMHRFILGAPDHMDVDHKDGNGLNNCRHNIRQCTESQNMGNAKKHSNNTSGFKGVSKYKDKFAAYIRVNTKKIHLGYYRTAEEAARIYDEAAKKYFGDFARLNFG